MSLKVSVFIATSLDGYIARANGDLDWLDAAQAKVPAGEDCGYQSFMQTVDLLIMGRKTYEKVLSFGAWPYGKTEVIVLSRTATSLPETIPATVTHSSEDPHTLCERLSRDGIRHIYVDGGNTVQRFLSAGLVDELTITIIPILLGKGIPLFGSLGADIHLSCVDTKQYEFGFTQLKYRIKRDA
ncbi:MAG: dihydrofolate reductase family protein [Cyanobacteria bacterium P01_A01_bin.17]